MPSFILSKFLFVLWKLQTYTLSESFTSIGVQGTDSHMLFSMPNVKHSAGNAVDSHWISGSWLNEHIYVH